MFSQASVILFTGVGGMHGGGGGDMCGSWHVWQGGCVAGEMATAADGMHPTGMHSGFVLNHECL